MKSFKLLPVLVVSVKVLMIIVGFAILLIMAIFIHSTISPGSYKKVIQDQYEGFYYNPDAPDAPTSYNEMKRSNNYIMYYNQLTFSSKFGVLLRYIILYGCVFLILRQVLNIMISARKYSSFFINNSKSFGKISSLIVFYMGFTFIGNLLGRSYTIMFADGGFTKENHSFNFNTYILLFLFLLLTYSASLVFKEGEKLKTENELTV